MKQHDAQDGPLRDPLGEAIRNIPYASPDPGLTRRIMSGLPPRKPGWIQRLQWATRTPITITVSPLLGAVTLLVVGFIAATFYHQIGAHRADGEKVALNDGVPVLFQFTAPSARTVAVMGTFNHWDPHGHEMTRDPKTGAWRLRLRLAPGKHAYVFWVDDEKTAPDPRADLIQEDGFGHLNSILFIKGNHDRSI